MSDTSEAEKPDGRMTAEAAVRVGRPPSVLHPRTGCCGCILRSAFADFSPKGQKYDFSAHFHDEFSNPESIPQWDVMKTDPFWVSIKVDSFRAFTRPAALMGDANRSLYGPWEYDISSIGCPVSIFQGRGDSAAGAGYPDSPEWVKTCIPHASFETIEGAGHMTSCGPIERMREQITTCVSNMPPLT